MPPESQTLTAVFLVRGGGSSFDKRERIAMEREREREARERERAEGEGRWVSDSGMRQLGQAAWLEADLIVFLSFPSHSDTLQHK